MIKTLTSSTPGTDIVEVDPGNTNLLKCAMDEGIRWILVQ